MTDPVLLEFPRGVKTDAPRMIDYGNDLTPVLGGVVQRIDRLGTRHSIQITLPLMRSEPDGRLFSARLRRAKLYGALAPFGQDGFHPGLPGAPVIDGAGQSGTTLALRGFLPGYWVREGQAFSHVHDGSHYLYFAAAAGRADGAGHLSLAIFPMLRVIPDDGDVCKFAQPMIEGSLSGNEVAWTRMTAPFCDFGTITITEQA